MCLHHISAEPQLSPLDVSSKLNVEWDFLEHLHGIGRETADNWLGRHFDSLQKCSTLDAMALVCREKGFDIEPGLRRHMADGADR